MAVLTQEAIEGHLEAAARACADQGAQLTELRRAVLSLVLQAERPLTAYQLLERLRTTRHKAVPPTIYRALDFLLQTGLIHKLERLGAFVPCGAGHHEHAAQFLICRLCRQVTELEDNPASIALDSAARAAGFVPSSMVVEIEGLCGACAAA